VSVIPHPSYIGVYPSQVSRAHARRQLGLDDGDFVYLFIGGIRPNKGIETLIKTFHSLTGDHLHLVIAGKSSGSSDYANRINESARTDTRIKVFDKFIPDSELQIYLNACDIVVLPFARILSSGSVMLALSFGRPVIAPAIGCLPETISPDSGLLYSPDDSASLEAALRQSLVLNLTAMGYAGLRSIEPLTWSEMASKTKDVYTS
jgi:glycosyltransferase involved in cell wall biosynthesis